MANVCYANVVGALMYAMVYTRPDISHTVSMINGICMTEKNSLAGCEMDSMVYSWYN